MNQSQSWATGSLVNNRDIRWVALTAVIFGAGFLHAFWYRHFQPDDAYIYLVYVKSFLNGWGLTFNGELVEGYSSVLWTLLVAALSWIGLDPLFASKLVGWFAYMVLGAILMSAHKLTSRADRGSIFTILLYFSFPSVALWASGALETILFSVLVALAAGSYFYARLIVPRHWVFLASGVAFGAVSLVRPEGFALIGSIVAFELILFAHGRKIEWRGAGLTVSICLALTVLMFVVRWLVYGKWFPATVGAKTGNLTWQMQNGLEYVVGFARSHYFFVGAYFASLVYAVAVVRKRSVEQYFLVLLLAILVFGYVAFNWIVGGDWMLGWRFLTPVIPFAVLTVGIALSHVEMRVAFSLMLLIVIGLFVQSVDLHALSVRQANSDKGDILMGKYVASLNLPRSEKIAVIDAGAIPYYAQLPTIDMIGLNDSYLSSLSGGFLQKYDNDYVLRNKPRIIQFHTKYINDSGDVAPTEAFRGSLVLFYNPEFQRWYERDRQSPVPHLFVRRNQPLDRTFLDTYFDAELEGSYQSGVLRVKVAKTGEGIWLSQKLDRLEAGVVYIRVRLEALNGRVLHERMVSVPKDMGKGDMAEMDIELQNSDLNSYRISACPVLLGVRELAPCATGKGYQEVVLDKRSVLGRGGYRFDDERLGLVGWSTFEGDHVWTLGRESVIKFNVKQNESIERLKLGLVSFGEQYLAVELNGVELYRREGGGGEAVVLSVAGLLKQENILRLKHPDARSPGMHDERVLAWALKEFVLE